MNKSSITFARNKKSINQCYWIDDGYLKYLIPQWGKMPKLDEGKIIECGFKKMAIYHEGKNKFRKCSALCPHIGAILRWNPVEKTWDCSAHGSHFDVDGKLINGLLTKR